MLKSLLARFTKVFLLYSCDQLLTLLGACLCSKYSVQICDIALQYTQQLIETLPLLAFRRIGEEFKVELYGILAFFSGALALLVPQVLQNGMMTKVLKILHNFSRECFCSFRGRVKESVLGLSERNYEGIKQRNVIQLCTEYPGRQTTGV